MTNLQGQLSFVTNQGATIEAGVYEEEYEEIQYSYMAEVDTSAKDWTPNIIHYSSDGTGTTEWLGSITTDFPTVDVQRSEYMVLPRARSVGYEWNFEEINVAMLMQYDLKPERVSVARRVAEEWVDDIFRNGHSEMGWEGFQSSNLPVRQDASDAAAGAGSNLSAKKWERKTNDEIIDEFNRQIIAPWDATLGRRLPDTVAISRNRWSLLSTRRLSHGAGSDGSLNTLLDWLRMNNAYTQATSMMGGGQGRPLKIVMFNELETAGAGGTERMITYQNDPRVLKFHMPITLTWEPPQQHYLRWIVPGYLRVAGLEIKLPAMMRYLDGI